MSREAFEKLVENKFSHPSLQRDYANTRRYELASRNWWWELYNIVPEEMEAQAPVVADNERLTESKNMILQGVVDLLKSARDNNSLITERMLIGITNKINAAEAMLKESKK